MSLAHIKHMEFSLSATKETTLLHYILYFKTYKEVVIPIRKWKTYIKAPNGYHTDWMWVTAFLTDHGLTPTLQVQPLFSYNIC